MRIGESNDTITFDLEKVKSKATQISKAYIS